jgi:hypothetical protein
MSNTQVGPAGGGGQFNTIAHLNTEQAGVKTDRNTTPPKKQQAPPAGRPV